MGSALYLFEGGSGGLASSANVVRGQQPVGSLTP